MADCTAADDEAERRQSTMTPAAFLIIEDGWLIMP
jgi:hypothetical protein